MLDVVRQYVDAAFGAIPKDRAMDLASRVTETIAGEVRKQLGALGVATKEDVDELRERLWRLESAAGPVKPSARTSKPAPRKKRPAASRKRAGSEPVVIDP